MAKKIFYTSLGFTLMLLLWQLSTQIYPHLHFVLPSPSMIALTLIEWKGRFFFHTLATLKEMIGGFCLAVSASFPLAWIMIRFKHTRTLLQPLFIIIQCLPMFALAPLMVVWCGWGYSAIVFPTALMIFFPLTLNIYQGLKATPESLLDFFRINNATELQTLLKLQLPWALPHIFSGLRIASAISGIGAVAGEWAGAQKGLGILMLESRRNFDLEITFGALFCLTLLSTTFYLLILLTEYLTTHRRYFSIPRLSFSLQWLKRKSRAVVFPLICSGLIFLCTSSCHKPPPSHQVRLLLDWLPNQNHTPLYVGIEMGYFQEEGIHLTLQKMHECGGVLSYLTTNQVDLAIYHTPGTLRAQTRGAQLKIVGSLIQIPLRALIYRDDGEPIQKPSDLSHKALGYCIGGPDTAFLDFLLAKGQIVPSEKRNVSVDLISAMGTKSVDVIYGGFWNIEPHILRSFNVNTKHFKVEDLGVPSYDEMIILANADTIYGKRSFALRFQRALHRSILFCKKYPERAFTYYAKQNPDKRTKTLLWEREAWEETYPLLAENQEVDLKKLRHFHQWQMDEAILIDEVNPSLLLP